TAEKTLPYTLEKEMLCFAAFSGSHLLRKSPPDRHVFNTRPSLDEEIAVGIDYLLRVKGLTPEQIAVFAQDDGFGTAGLGAVERALRKHGRGQKQTVQARYQRNSRQVDAAVKEILAHKEVRAVVLVSSYRPGAQLIKELRSAKPEMDFVATAFIGTE